MGRGEYWIVAGISHENCMSRFREISKLRPRRWNDHASRSGFDWESTLQDRGIVDASNLAPYNIRQEFQYYGGPKWCNPPGL